MARLMASRRVSRGIVSGMLTSLAQAVAYDPSTVTSSVSDVTMPNMRHLATHC